VHRTDSPGRYSGKTIAFPPCARKAKYFAVKKGLRQSATHHWSGRQSTRDGDPPRHNRFFKMPVFVQAVRESARNSVPLSNGLGVVDVNVFYHSLSELAMGEAQKGNPQQKIGALYE
jgi:hypothetical protein